MSRSVRSALLGSLACVAAIGLVPAASTAAEAPLSTPQVVPAGAADDTLATARAHGRCIGGGRISLVVEETDEDSYRVRVSGRSDDGRRWSGDVVAITATRREPTFDFDARTVDGTWTARGVLEADDPFAFLVGAESGQSFCLLANSTERPAFAFSFCRGGLAAVLTAVDRPRTDEIAVRYRVFGPRPDGIWAMRVRAEGPDSAQALTVWDRASRRGTVRAVGAVSGYEDPRLHASATGPRGQRCGMGFQHTALGSGDLMAPRVLARTVERVRVAGRELRHGR